MRCLHCRCDFAHRFDFRVDSQKTQVPYCGIALPGLYFLSSDLVVPP